MTEAEVSDKRRISFIWVVPIVALLLGLWMVIYTIQQQGPEITIVFSSAAGIEAGKTKIKVREVSVGVVESAGLSDDFEQVVLTAQIDKVAASLLREDTQFWVVRPRIGPGGISGLGTLLSGGYIRLAPGTGAEGTREFVGLEEPPVTPTGTPGLSLRLTSDRAGSVSSGDPIVYKGYQVGRIESATFDVPAQQMHYKMFIQAPYDALVTSHTRFWNVSGVSLRASADGLELDTGSLQTILMGGVTFGLPEGVRPGGPVSQDTSFRLHRNYASVNDRPYRHGLEYVVSFEQGVRGLRSGAPVEWRGFPVGRVERVLLKELTSTPSRGRDRPIPVLIRLEPGRLELPDTAESLEVAKEGVARAVKHGLRATLATGSLLTGAKYVSLDFHANQPPAEIGSFEDWPTIPTITSGLEGIEQRVASLLDKLNALPVDETVDRVNRVLADVDGVLASKEMQTLPRSLETTLVELRGTLESVSGDSAMQERLMRTLTQLDRTLHSMRALLDTLEQKPNAIIFSRDPGEDPRPQAGAP